MVLDSKTIKEINDFVYVKPRSVLEIAHHIGKNWRTADHYVERISKEQGTLSKRTFREGTRGALKIVYWNTIDKIHSSSFQERLFRKIESGCEKTDFDPLDIYQYVDDKKKRAFVEEFQAAEVSTRQQIVNFLRQTESTLLCFSGNMSFVNIVEGKKTVLGILKELTMAKKSIKILARVDIASLKNLQMIEEVNSKLGREAIEVRHCRQPLRGFVVDTKVARLKDEKVIEKYKPGELRKNTRTFYEIYDEEWVSWLQKVFWELFRSSVSAQQRLETLKSLDLSTS
jgi:hypothetical protein